MMMSSLQACNDNVESPREAIIETVATVDFGATIRRLKIKNWSAPMRSGGKIYIVRSSRRLYDAQFISSGATILTVSNSDVPHAQRRRFFPVRQSAN